MTRNGLILTATAALALAASQAQAADSTRIEVTRKDPYGAYLTDGAGRSLYLFKADSKAWSNCYDACAKAWPPLTAQGKPAVGQGAEAGLADTMRRKDGSTQVTYDGWPLYYFVKDKAPGDTRGQDIKGFGAEWYLVSPKGGAVHAESKKSGSK